VSHALVLCGLVALRFGSERGWFDFRGGHVCGECMIIMLRGQVSACASLDDALDADHDPDARRSPCTLCHS
jgi:hypothetical protein